MKHVLSFSYGSCTVVFLLSIFHLLLFRLPCSSQWSTSPLLNNAICTAEGTQSPVQPIGDGAGGAIIAWNDTRNGDADVFAQRMSAAGVALWTANGVGICVATGGQGVSALASDGVGGAILVYWNDQGASRDLFAQRVDASGSILWSSSGVVICSEAGAQDASQIVSDGAGGAIIVWCDTRPGASSDDIYAQRVNAQGTVQWLANGVAICTAASSQSIPQIVSDGAGGATISWRDSRNGNYDIFAQRIGADGSVLWTTQGVAICTVTSEQGPPQIVSDDAGGAIISWYDTRNGNKDIYAQQVNASGLTQWTADGVVVCAASGDQILPRLIGDGAGGAIITFNDGRNADVDIFAQRVNASGVVMWTANGVAISSATGTQGASWPIASGADGAIIIWADNRNGNYDVYAQRVNGEGVAQWIPNGVAVSTATAGLQSPKAASGGASGVIVTWDDYRGGEHDVYAQYVDRYGNLGMMGPTIAGCRDVINDQGGQVLVEWGRSLLDQWPTQTITSYLVWRGVGSAAAQGSVRTMPRAEYMERVSNNLINKALPEFVYESRASGTTGIYWQHVATVSSHWLAGYSYPVTTLSDSGQQGIPWHYFMVTAATSDPLVYWDSQPDSAYSVDNLAPAVVSRLTATLASATSARVHWPQNTVDSDIGGYTLYRSTASDFVPSESNRLAAPTDTSYLDTSLPTAPVIYYRVCARDVHGNLGEPSPQAAIAPMSTQSYAVGTNWNMISVPMTVSDFSKATLYPTATSEAFSYSGGYTAQSTVQNGVGYWLKFPSSQIVSLTGYALAADTIAVTTGWNMIGSIGAQVQVSQIVSNPPGLTVSPFWGYSSGYKEATAIEPHKGYWVKASQTGQLILSAMGGVSGKINIIATKEQPPLPPFLTGVATTDVPRTFALEQNYPNPFNPKTGIRYQVPGISDVRLAVYDLLGREVAVLVNGRKEPGWYTVEFDASGLASGTYLYRMKAGDFVETRKLVTLR